MRIFLSYSTPDRGAAEEIALGLEAQGHDVFFDRTELEGGTDYNSVIRAQVQQADLLIYLISAASVRQGSYALTELKFARQKWPHPGRNVLPVLLHPTPLDAIPAYLRSVTLFEPEGAVAAEVAAHVAAIRPRSRRRAYAAIGVILAALLVALAVRQMNGDSLPRWDIEPDQFITGFVYPEGAIERETYELDPTFSIDEDPDQVLQVTRVAYGSISDVTPAISVMVQFKNETAQPLNLDFDERFFSLTDDQNRKATLLYFCCESGAELLHPNGTREMQLIFGAHPGWSGKELQAHRLALRVNGLLPVASAVWVVPTLATAN